MEAVKNSVKLTGSTLLFSAAGFTAYTTFDNIETASQAVSDFKVSHQVPARCDSSIGSHVTRLASPLDTTYMAECRNVAPEDIDSLMLLHKNVNDASYSMVTAFVLGSLAVPVFTSGIAGLRRSKSSAGVAT